MEKKSILIVDQLYKYEIDQVLEGGMGRVYLLTRKSNIGESSLDNNLYEKSFLQDAFKFPYRKKLAAKTIKENSLLRDFERECIIWLGLNGVGIAPLLKVAKINGIIYALMPRYSYSLRDLLRSQVIGKTELAKLLIAPITGLSNIHITKGLVHQDIKPENLLCFEDGKNISIFLSDWGIANLQANLLSKASLISSKFTFQTMVGFGTLPYMAPERLLSYSSTISADIFSFGIVFFEILTGELPYNISKPIDNQLVNGEYYFAAKKILSGYSSRKFPEAILLMIHPQLEKRIQCYKDILRIIKSL
ncbi:MAG: hypothetical protein FJZ96_00655 [Chloroflexi bacterium]|nr:hypothetical protein [Chloroflexota bacterium]